MIEKIHYYLRLYLRPYLGETIKNFKSDAIKDCEGELKDINEKIDKNNYDVTVEKIKNAILKEIRRIEKETANNEGMSVESDDENIRDIDIYISTLKLDIPNIISNIIGKVLYEEKRSELKKMKTKRQNNDNYSQVISEIETIEKNLDEIDVMKPGDYKEKLEILNELIKQEKSLDASIGFIAAVKTEDIINKINEIKELFSNSSNKLQGRNLYSLLINFIEELGQTEQVTKNENGNIPKANYTTYAEYMKTIPGYYAETVLNGNLQNAPWCSTFITRMFVDNFGSERGRELLNQTPGNARANSTAMAIQYYREKDRNSIFADLPQIGDQAFFIDVNEKDVNHTGFVCGIYNGYVYIIEGNTTPEMSKVVEEGVGVFLKKYPIGQNQNNIIYTRPKYTDEENIEPTEADVVSEKIAELYELIQQKAKDIDEELVILELPNERLCDDSIIKLKETVKKRPSLKTYLRYKREQIEKILLFIKQTYNKNNNKQRRVG